MVGLHVAEIGALAELGGTYLELNGKVVMPTPRRISDLANDEDELLDLTEAQVRVHMKGEGLWESVPGLTLNRDEVLMLIPISEAVVNRDDLVAPGHSVRVKLFVGPLEVTGFVNVPVDQTVSGWHRTTRTRFLSVTQARVQPFQEDLQVENGEGVYKFVLINRRRLTALIETRRPEPAATAQTPPEPEPEPEPAPKPEAAAPPAAEVAPDHWDPDFEGWQPPVDPIEPA